jgi:hypothetical protein
MKPAWGQGLSAYGQAVRNTTQDPTTTTATDGGLQARCDTHGVFAIEQRDVFNAAATYCPQCTDRAELVPAGVGATSS